MAQLPLGFRSGPKADEETAEKTVEAPTVYSVSEIQRELRLGLEKKYRSIFVAGEISNFQTHERSGHAYFSLKDDDAVLSCVMWRDNASRLRFRPEDGLEVIARGMLTVYEKGGRLQMSVQRLEPRGLGALQQSFRQLLQALQKEGLTAQERKRPLPRFPRTLGVVTSRSGAALSDILRTAFRRDPALHVIIADVPVQGTGHGATIADRLLELDALGLADVIILARGGGSMEDLWSFNEEALARAIPRTRVPVITGVGHETDVTIVDFVADLRASTPTAAAEHAVPIRSEVRRLWLELETRLQRGLALTTQGLSNRLLELSGRLRDPRSEIRRRAQFLDELTMRLERALRNDLSAASQRAAALDKRLARQEPAARIAAASHALGLSTQRMLHAVDRRRRDADGRLSRLVGQLESLSPLKVLSRGYAIVRTQGGVVVRRRADVSRGDTLDVRLGEGAITVNVVDADSADGADGA